jgi:hypothetical protein
LINFFSFIFFILFFFLTIKELTHTSNSNSTVFEISKDIRYNFPHPTNKNLFISNLSPEAIEDFQNYGKFKGYIKDNNIIISDYYQSNLSRYIINPENKWYPIQILDSRYIENSDLSEEFTRDIIEGKYKDIFINPYCNYLITTIDGKPSSII